MAQEIRKSGVRGVALAPDRDARSHHRATEFREAAFDFPGRTLAISVNVSYCVDPIGLLRRLC